MSHFVDITPHVSLLAKTGQAGHSVAEAVAELVDNAVDARCAGQAVTVEVRYDAKRNWLEVQDDGVGMSRTELADALVLALSTKGNEQIGKFGLGMKAACTSLGKRFQINTCRDGDHYATIADYDEQRFLEAGTWQLPISRRKKKRAHGTTITIDSTRVYATLNQSLVKNLGSTFRHFIRDGVLTLFVNGVLVEPEVRDVDADSVLPLQGEVDGTPVRGWVGLLRTSSQRGWYGFDLVRHRRVIRRYEKLGFQGHPQYARVAGELHLDGFETNNLKTDFIRETTTWRSLEAWVAESLEPILSASRALAHSGAFDRRLKSLINEERERILAALGDGGLIGADDFHFRPMSRFRVQGRSDAISLVIGSFHIEHRFGSEADGPFMRRSKFERLAEADLIEVITNFEFLQVNGEEAVTLACHNIAETVALELATGSEDYVEVKTKLWRLIAGQPGLQTALRRTLTAARRNISSETAILSETT
jgi:anti-sigma regulatory factor (Ser/Thr protein kinase)